MSEIKAPKEPILDRMLEANKRAHEILDSTRALSAKLYGSRPESSPTRQGGEICLAELLDHMIEVMAESESELTHMHNGLGTTSGVGSQGASNRAVGR